MTTFVENHDTKCDPLAFKMSVYRIRSISVSVPGYDSRHLKCSSTFVHRGRSSRLVKHSKFFL